MRHNFIHANKMLMMMLLLLLQTTSFVSAVRHSRWLVVTDMQAFNK